MAPSSFVFASPVHERHVVRYDGRAHPPRAAPFPIVEICSEERFMSRASLVLSWVAASLVIQPAFAQGGHGRPAKTYSSGVAVAWFDLMYDRIKADGISPPV